MRVRTTHRSPNGWLVTECLVSDAQGRPEGRVDGCKRGRLRFGEGIAFAISILLTATLVSCSSSREDPKADQPKPKATPTALVVSVKPTQLKKVEKARVELPAEPDWLVSGFGSLWTLRGNGSVVRLSPKGKVQATIDAKLFKFPVCQGLGVSADAVWACATSGKIVRIDPHTNDIAATINVPKINEQGRLASVGGRLWLLTGDGDRLTGISEKTNKIGDPIKLGTYCTDIADRAVGNTLWVACASEGVLLRVDLAKRKVTGKVTDLPLATSVSVGEDVWVGFEKGLARIDPRSLDVTMLQEAVTPESIRAVGNHVWVREKGGRMFLTRLDASTAEVRQVIAADDLKSGGDVIEFEGAVWASSYDDLTIVRLTP
jgi:streptogramin lyase